MDVANTPTSEVCNLLLPLVVNVPATVEKSDSTWSWTMTVSYSAMTEVEAAGAEVCGAAEGKTETVGLAEGEPEG